MKPEVIFFIILAAIIILAILANSRKSKAPKETAKNVDFLDGYAGNQLPLYTDY